MALRPLYRKLCGCTKFYYSIKNVPAEDEKFKLHVQKNYNAMILIGSKRH